MKSTLDVRLILALLALYIIWGSTYLAIHVAVETMPPFLMAGVRFLAAGVLMVLWQRMRGAEWPVLPAWKNATITGGCLLLGGNGLVVWASRWIPSGVAALLVGATPFYITVLDWLVLRGKRPTKLTWSAIAAGFAGVVLLTWGRFDSAHGGLDIAGVIAVLLGALSWSAGSLYGQRVPKYGVSPAMAAGAQMIAGGVLLVLVACLLGEVGAVQPSAWSVRSLWAFGYLIVFGSLVGFTAYVYALAHSTPAVATSYAFVNPLVAVVLGATLGNEPLSQRVIGAAVLICGAVAMLTWPRKPAERQA